MEVLIALGAGCLLIRLGVAFYGIGMIRAKNAAGAVLRTICDLCVAVLAFWLIGAAILTQTHNTYFAFNREMIAFAGGGTAGLFFLTSVVLVGTAIAGGALAERSKFFPLCAASFLLSAIVIPIGANWAWTGWLARRGFVDVGGATWLHLSGAICGLVGAIFVGARSGKYHHDGSASMIPGHNVPLAGFGVLTMLVGWGPYLAGCLVVALDRPVFLGAAATGVILAAAGGGLAAILLGHYRYGKPDVIITLLGLLGAMVAISAGAGHLSAAWCVFVGAVAGLLVPLSAIWIDLFGRIDDPGGVIAVHGVGGIWGTLATGLLMPGSFADRARQTGIQILGIVCIGLLALALSMLLFVILRATVRLRAGEADEYDGLDLAEHDIGAYPDFQQTMIKSYHLREA